MRRIAFLFLALSSAAVIAGRASQRPRYGGTLRMETHAALTAIDPDTWPADPEQAALQEQLLNLVSDRLVRMNEAGRCSAALAVNWQPSSDGKVWTLNLRPAVKLHDGANLARSDILAILSRANTKWRVTAAPADRASLVISSDSALPDLPAELAAARYSIVRRNPAGELAATGPFRIAEWQPRHRVVLVANDEYWDGRPFLDRVEITMGRPLREQLQDLELGRTDVVELAPDYVRHVEQGKARIWASRSNKLMALLFDEPPRRGTDNARAREALSLSIDRTTLRDVLLQKQGEAAWSLLPQWLSGYAFLFTAPADPERARRLWSEAGAGTLTLSYDASDALSRAVANRIAVNARAAGIALQVATQGAVDVRLVHARIDSNSARFALAELAAALRLSKKAQPANAIASGGEPAELYAAERELLADNRVIPLVFVPEIYALGPAVRDWLPASIPGAGGWRLEDVWVEREAK